MKASIYKLLLITLIIIVWFSHLIQVFVPETGFDALWYHLPVIKAVKENKGLIYLPYLEQSLNPLFSDLIFGIGYLFIGNLGIKIIAYFFALSLIFVSYKLSKKYLNSSWSLLLILLISTFQVITWQSASFYVDIAKAFFEINSLYFLHGFLFKKENMSLRKNLKNKRIIKDKQLITAGLFFGASLATKLFSLFLLPVYLLLIFIFSQKEKLKNSLVFLLSSLLLPLPFYIFAYLNTGNPFYSFAVHLQKLEEIGGNSSLFAYILERIIKFPYSLFELFLARDYVSFIFLVFLPLIIYLVFYRHQKVFKKQNILLLIFALFQYLLWWFLPPLSSRYALSGFIILALFYLILLLQVIKENKNYLLPIIISILLSISINFLPRIFVNIRSLKYILKFQTKEEYLKQFLDGSIDNNIKEWYFGTTLYQFK